LKTETENPRRFRAVRMLKLAIVLPESPDRPAITSLGELVVIV
jgi:hypothetical protein